MADNYLENCMEDYRKGKPAYRQKKTSTGRKPGEVTFKLKPKRIFVPFGFEGDGREVIKMFVSYGCKVAFCCCDDSYGNPFAQETGARCLPIDPSDMKGLEEGMDTLFHDWGDIDLIIHIPDIVNKLRFITGESLPKPEKMAKYFNEELLPLYTIAHRFMDYRASLPVPNPYGRLIVVDYSFTLSTALLHTLKGPLILRGIDTAVVTKDTPEKIARDCLMEALREPEIDPEN